MTGSSPGSAGLPAAPTEDAVRLFLAAVSDLDGMCSEEGRHNAKRDILVYAPVVAASLVAAEARAEKLQAEYAKLYALTIGPHDPDAAPGAPEGAAAMSDWPQREEADRFREWAGPVGVDECSTCGALVRNGQAGKHADWHWESESRGGEKP